MIRHDKRVVDVEQASCDADRDDGCTIAIISGSPLVNRSRLIDSTWLRIKIMDSLLNNEKGYKDSGLVLINRKLFVSWQKNGAHWTAIG